MVFIFCSTIKRILCEDTLIVGERSTKESIWRVTNIERKDGQIIEQQVINHSVKINRKANQTNKRVRKVLRQ